MNTKDKLAALRKEMVREKIDIYIVNTADPHQSEYVSEHYRERTWLSGFTGSQGTVVVTKDQALLWADGRYYIQAEKEIKGSDFTLMKLGRKEVPKVKEWVSRHAQKGTRVGVSEEIYSQSNFEELNELVKAKGASLIALPSLVARIWEDKPALPSAPIFKHDIRFTGKTAKEKIEEVRKQLQEDEADTTIIVGLDDVAWLYNFRGADVPHNPVALAFAIVSLEEAVLFIDQNKLDETMQAYFAEQNILVLDYNEISDYISKLEGKRLVVQKSRISTKLYQSIPEKADVLDKKSYVTMNKATLNEVELACQRKAYLRDSAAITRFLFWLKDKVNTSTVNEYEAALKLLEFRSAGKNFLDESFTSISAYGPNAAMMHYTATKDNCTLLEEKSLYLIDSGGQYLDGTTDITRTIALGELTEEEIRDYTLTLKGHVNLASAVFLEDTTGLQLEGLARQALWKHHLDYKCGTGHAVGYVLGVHEGPHGISKGSILPLQEGMIVTNEPGVYKEGKHGIRIENVHVVVFDGEAMGDRFFRFDTLSLVPFENEAIDPVLLNEEELAWINDYHREVYEKLIDYMVSDEEKEALEQACAPLRKYAMSYSAN